MTTVPTVTDALHQLLADVIGIAGGRAAYGCSLADPEHPFHESVTAALAALAAAGEPLPDIG